VRSLESGGDNGGAAGAMSAQRAHGAPDAGHGATIDIKRRIRPAASVLWFAALGVLVLGPLLRPGYLLLLDAPAGPLPRSYPLAPLPSEGLVSAGAPFGQVTRLLDLVLPQATNKVLVFLTILLGGWGLYRFARFTLQLSSGSSFVGATLFAVNPWTYDRLLAGQLLLTLAFALLAWALPGIHRLIAAPRTTDLIRASAWCAAIGLVDLHVGGMCLLLACFALLVGSDAYPRRVLQVVGVVALVGVLHAYWVMPAALGDEGARLSASDVEAFAPVPRSLQVLPHVLLLHGFWRTEFDTALSSHPQRFLLCFVPLVAMATLGLNAALSSPVWRRAATGLGLACGAAIVLGMGTSFRPTAGLTRWLFRNVPGYGIYREPQKWIGLLALGYALFAAVGSEWIRRRLPFSGARVAFCLAATGLPLVATSVMLWGFDGQVRVSEFPSDWERGAQLLAHKRGRLLLLPWNLYQPLPFADGRVIANPADRFFPIPSLMSSDPRIGGTRTADPRLDLISEVIRSHRRVRKLGHVIAPLGVRYVALARVGDARRYRWVRRQEDLQVIHQGRELVLWENTAWRGDSYGLQKSSDTPASLEQLLSTRGGDRLPADTLIPLKPDTVTGILPEIPVSRELPGWRRPALPETTALGTSLSCLDGWRLGRSEPICHVGAAAAFPSAPGARILWRPGLAVQLIAYGVSAVAWACVAATIARQTLWKRLKLATR
jgi:hypothetical protein